MNFPPPCCREHLGDRRGQRRLSVVDVADRPDVDVRLVALELFLRHLRLRRFRRRRRSGVPEVRSPGLIATPIKATRVVPAELGHRARRRTVDAGHLADWRRGGQYVVRPGREI